MNENRKEGEQLKDVPAFPKAVLGHACLMQQVSLLQNPAINRELSKP